MSVKKLIRTFYRNVHPDLMNGYHPEAIECNSRSLKDLNAYIDRLESTELIPGPFVSKTIQFFKPVLKRNGQRVPSALKPCTILLESIPPSADMLERESLSIRLVRQVENSMVDRGLFSTNSAEGAEIEPIIKSAALPACPRTELDRIWSREDLDNRIHDSMFKSADERASQFREYQSILMYNKLMNKYSKLRNTKRRNRRISGIEAEVAERLAESPSVSMIDGIDTSVDQGTTHKIRVIESGFHPDLVFVDPSLITDEREAGIAQICGVNLTQEPDTWLLENIWKAVRKGKSPAVPIVLSRDFHADTAHGYLSIPFNFQLPALVDFMEDNLELVRDARRELLLQHCPV